jgi:hypothetical protein
MTESFLVVLRYAFRQCYAKTNPIILEPVMNVEIKAPQEFQGSVVSGVNRRKGLIVGSETEGDDVVINAHVSALCDCYIHLSFNAVFSIRRVTYLLGLLLYVWLKEPPILLLCLFEEKGD